MPDTPKTTIETDSLDQRYACMKCSTTFRLGKVKMHLCSDQHPYGLACPNCGSGHGLHPANGETMALDDYQGERGSLQ